MSERSDKEVIRQLASRTPIEADASVDEILRRGDAILELLLSCRGDEQSFAGSSLLNPDASILTPVEIEGYPLPESQRVRMVTVEVAALYLCSAIYRGNRHFAQAPLLVDLNEPEGARTAANTRDRLDRGFKAAESWVAECRKSGLAAMRSRNREPLFGTSLRWY
jgi:hypothetical protein